MIDDRQEELAALYALDLLAPGEAAQFEAEVARVPALQSLVRELRDASAALAHAAPAIPPPAELKTRVLRALPPQLGPEPAAGRSTSPISFRAVWPWAIAAGFALCSAWTAQLYLSSRSEAELWRSAASLREVGLQQARNQFETERVIATRHLSNLETQLATNTSQLAVAQSQLTDRDRQIAQLADEHRTQLDLANLKITALASMLENSPAAHAVAIWDPARQQGVLEVEKLPALSPQQDYQLWVVDPQYPQPVDGGVFTVKAENGTARLTFRAKQPIGAVAAFAVTRERKGGVPKAEGPFVLLGK